MDRTDLQRLSKDELIELVKRNSRTPVLEGRSPGMSRTIVGWPTIPMTLIAMRTEIRSLGTDEDGIKRFRKLGLEHQELIAAMPTDVQTSLAELNEAFIKEYSDHDVAVRKAEEELKQKKLSEEQSAEQEKELTLVYLIYMEL